MTRKISLLSTAEIDGLDEKTHLPTGVKLTVFPFVRIIYEEQDGLRQKIEELVERKVTIAFTSKHAVRAVAKMLQEKPKNWTIYCLGKYTYSAVRECFEECAVIQSGETAVALSASLLHNAIGEVVFFCGDKRLDTLPNTLSDAGVHVNELIVYRNEECSEKLHDSYDGILFYSPSAVHSFFKENTIDPDAVLFAIGDTTAAAIYDYTHANVVSGRVAGKLELLKKSIEYFS